MTIHATIHAIIRTQAPLHIAHPQPGELRTKLDLTETRGKDAGGFPTTGVQTMPLLTPEGSRRLPVIAGNNLAGHLRRDAANIVLEAIAKRGEKVQLDTYSVLMCGAASGRPSKDDLTYPEYVTASQNAYFGLFGGGPKMLRRNVRVHNALPTTREVLELRGSFAHPSFEANLIEDVEVRAPAGATAGQDDASAVPAKRPRRLISTWGFRRVDDLRDLGSIASASSQVEDFENALLARQHVILADKDDETGEADDKTRQSTKTYSFLQFVPPGVTFDALFELAVETPAQIGLFLAALERFAQQDRLGGYTRNGFGVVGLEGVLLSIGNAENIEVLDGERRLQRSNKSINYYVACWEGESEALTAAELDGIAIDTAPKKADKKAKGAKKAQAEAEA